MDFFTEPAHAGAVESEPEAGTAWAVLDRRGRAHEIKKLMEEGLLNGSYAPVHFNPIATENSKAAAMLLSQAGLLRDSQTETHIRMEFQGNKGGLICISDVERGVYRKILQAQSSIATDDPTSAQWKLKHVALRPRVVVCEWTSPTKNHKCIAAADMPLVFLCEGTKLICPYAGLHKVTLELSFSTPQKKSGQPPGAQHTGLGTITSSVAGGSLREVSESAAHVYELQAAEPASWPRPSPTLVKYWQQLHNGLPPAQRKKVTCGCPSCVSEIERKDTFDLIKAASGPKVMETKKASQLNALKSGSSSSGVLALGRAGGDGREDLGAKRPRSSDTDDSMAVIDGALQDASVSGADFRLMVCHTSASNKLQHAFAGAPLRMQEQMQPQLRPAAGAAAPPAAPQPKPASPFPAAGSTSMDTLDDAAGDPSNELSPPDAYHLSSFNGLGDCSDDNEH